MIQIIMAHFSSSALTEAQFEKVFVSLWCTLCELKHRLFMS